MSPLRILLSTSCLKPRLGAGMRAATQGHDQALSAVGYTIGGTARAVNTGDRVMAFATGMDTSIEQVVEHKPCAANAHHGQRLHRRAARRW
jgi:hypothetical protein